MSIFSSKLSELMDQQKINDAQLAEKLNISRTTVLRWRSGERSPKLGKMNEIAAFFGVSPKVFVEQNLLSQIKNNESKSAIPKYGYVTAGPDGTAFQEFLGYEIFDDVTNPEDYFALDVSGDSMTGDGILDGDTVLIQVQPTIDYNGQIAVVIINGEEGTLKHVYINDGSITLQSSNLAYQPRIFIGEECSIIKIAGVLKELKRKWK